MNRRQWWLVAVVAYPLSAVLVQYAGYYVTYPTALVFVPPLLFLAFVAAVGVPATTLDVAIGGGPWLAVRTTHQPRETSPFEAAHTVRGFLHATVLFTPIYLGAGLFLAGVVLQGVNAFARLVDVVQSTGPTFDYVAVVTVLVYGVIHSVVVLGWTVAAVAVEGVRGRLGPA